MEITFYAPTMLDLSMTRPDKKGRQHPTGNLNGMIFTRTFRRRGENIKASRGIISFSWGERPGAKEEALLKALGDMEELHDLDSNPPLNWIPSIVKEKLK